MSDMEDAPAVRAAPGSAGKPMADAEASDTELVEAYRHGQAGAFESLMVRHGPPLMAYFRGSAGRGADA
ncbi:MAG: hypothetical protein PHR35_19655, partial [Kiritimatiellae bacterium]|nr:hypothetical protein [Kiritimatiellia bacterium]